MRRFVSSLGLSPVVSSQLVSSEETLHFFEECVGRWKPLSSVVVANLLLNDVPLIVRDATGHQAGNDDKVSFGHLTPQALSRLADLKHSGELPHNLVFAALEMLIEGRGGAQGVDDLVSSCGWGEGAPRDPEAIRREAERVLAAMPKTLDRASAALARGNEKKMRRAMAELLNESTKTARTRLDMKMVAEALEREIRKGGK